jgi:hypothetical protein
MSDPSRLEYCFLRYLRNVVSDEGINLAVIIVDANRENETCKISLANEWESKVRLLDSDADVALLTELLKDIQRRLLSEDRRFEMIRLIEESFSNAIQMTQWRKYLLIDNGDALDVIAGDLLGEARDTPRGFAADSR